MTLRLGTSGWSYADWVGPFYPKAMDPARYLEHYATRFATVEINSTFYATPTRATVRSWVERSRAWPGFEFSVKAPRALTQDALARGTPEDARRVAEEFHAAVLDLLEPRLGAVLLQLAPSVRNDGATLRRIEAALEALSSCALAVEVRDASWAEDDALLETLDRYGAALVALDGPHLPLVVAGDAPHAYVRFHGRNADVWEEHGKVEADPTDPRLNRYDYDYARAELEPWAERLAALEKRKRVVRVYFNNHPGAHAASDADELRALLAARGVPLDAPVAGGQRRLDLG